MIEKLKHIIKKHLKSLVTMSKMEKLLGKLFFSHFTFYSGHTSPNIVI